MTLLLGHLPEMENNKNNKVDFTVSLGFHNEVSHTNED